MLRDRHLSYFLLLAEEAEPHLRGKDQVYWLDLLELELDNLRYAIEWSLSRRVDTGQRLASALKWFWHIRGYAQEGIEWIERLLDTEQSNQSESGYGQPAAKDSIARKIARGNALSAAGMLILFRYQDEQGVSFMQKSLALFESLGEAGLHGKAINMIYLSNTKLDWDLRLLYTTQALEILEKEGDMFHQAEAHMNLGHMYTEKKVFEPARKHFQESLTLREKLNDLDGLGMGIGDMAGLMFQLGEYNQAFRYFEQALSYFQTVGNSRLIAYIQSSLGTVAMIQGNYNEAADRYEKVIRMSRMSGDQFAIAQGLYDLATLSWERGEFEQAVTRYEELVALTQKLGAKPFISYALTNLAGACLSLNDAARAEALIKEAVEVSSEWSGDNHDPNFMLPTMLILALIKVAQERYEPAAKLLSYANHSPVWNVKLMTPRQRAEYEKGLAQVKQNLDEETFNAAWESGRSMTGAQAAAMTHSV
jgi:tetratricopeptide (TPR) repeat protein